MKMKLIKAVRIVKKADAKKADSMLSDLKSFIPRLEESKKMRKELVDFLYAEISPEQFGAKNNGELIAILGDSWRKILHGYGGEISEVGMIKLINVIESKIKK